MFNLTTQSIAHPLWVDLPDRPLGGHVIGVHRRSCNLLCGSLPERSRIITMAEPSVGNGPFTILVDGIDKLLIAIAPNQPIQISNQQLTIGQWTVDLSGVELWEPQLRQLAANFWPTEDVVEIMQPYRTWPLDEHNSSTSQATSRALRLAADAFLAALVADDAHALAESTARLAGLGIGLTPAGDDFLVGALAALWIHQRTEHLALIAQHATERTTLLSAAFLRAATQGRFVEPWHLLLEALHAGDAVGVTQAIEGVAQIGASSGRDALAGFSEVYALFVPTAA